MTTQSSTIIGIDLGKNWFHIVQMDRQGHIMNKKKLSRHQLRTFVYTETPTIVAFEACPGSQYWGRCFSEAGFEVKIIPAQFVKPYLKSNKNDFNDAEAIAEAASRGTMRFVPLKSDHQLYLQATHRVRQRFITERTATVNQMRALLLEFGITVAVGRKLFERNLPDILEDAENGLPDYMRSLIFRLRERWILLDEQINEMSEMLNTASALGEWVRELEKSHHHHVVLIALANKIMRICWKVLTSGIDYANYPMKTA